MRGRTLAVAALLLLASACSGRADRDVQEAAFRHLFGVQAQRDPADGPRVLRIDDAVPDDTFLARFEGEVPPITAAPGDARGTAFWLTNLQFGRGDRATLRGGYATATGATREFDLALTRQGGRWVVTAASRR